MWGYTSTIATWTDSAATGQREKSYIYILLSRKTTIGNLDNKIFGPFSSAQGEYLQISHNPTAIENNAFIHHILQCLKPLARQKRQALIH